MPLFGFRRRRARLRVRHLAPDRYLTDGRSLFRVVDRFVNDGSILVVIEDCSTLDARAYAATELLPMDVRPVRHSKARPAVDPSPQVAELAVAAVPAGTGAGAADRSRAASSG
jgi:hypothetical protein